MSAKGVLHSFISGRAQRQTEAAEGMQQIQAVLQQLTNDDVESVFIHWFAMMQGFVALARHDCHPEQAGRFEQLVEDAVGRFIKGL